VVGNESFRIRRSNDSSVSICIPPCVPSTFSHAVANHELGMTYFVSPANNRIMMIPPTKSARTNCQQSNTHMTRPSSITRFVEANMNPANAASGDAPFLKSEREVATAANEHDEQKPASLIRYAQPLSKFRFRS
jgi:hypothetical protein